MRYVTDTLLNRKKWSQKHAKLGLKKSPFFAQNLHILNEKQENHIYV